MIRPLLCSTLLLSGLPQHALAQDTLTVKVRDDPVWGTHPQLVEELRIGAMEGDPDYTFGVVAGVATDVDGTLWVSDRLFGTLRRYTPEGRHVDDVGRKGKGPGEFNYLMDLRRLPNGDVAVWDPINTRIHVFQADGTFARDITVPVPGMLGLPQNFEVDSAGRFYAVSMDFPEDGRSGPATPTGFGSRATAPSSTRFSTAQGTRTACTNRSGPRRR